MQEMEKSKGLLDAVEQYVKLYKAEKTKFPYRLNVIKELHDDENAHSRILIRLLKYKGDENYKYPWLHSFVNRMNEYCQGNIDVKISNPDIDTQVYIGKELRGFIDGYIIEKGKYAIIVENKIWDADDTYKQIERYVTFSIEDKGIPKKNIFVIYLTKDGSKVVGDDSLTKKAKQILENRFIPMSFQYDIIPWLEEDVLPNCKIKEKCLETAIYQYIDYLKGICGLLDYQKQAKENTFKQLLKYMEIKETDIVKQIETLKNLKKLTAEFENNIKEIVVGDFTSITKSFFAEKYPSEKWILNDKISSRYYQVYKENWKMHSVHLEWIPISIDRIIDSKTLTLVLHIEGKKSKDFRNLLCDSKEMKFNDDESSTYYTKEYEIPYGKTFAELDYTGRKSFLYDVYGSQEIQTLIKVVDDTFEYFAK